MLSGVDRKLQQELTFVYSKGLFYLCSCFGLFRMIKPLPRLKLGQATPENGNYVLSAVFVNI